MALTVEAAATAGALAAAINARVIKLAQIQVAVDAGWSVSRFSVVGPEEAEVSLILNRLDAQTSASALALAKEVYEAQLVGLQAELAAL